MVGAWVVFQSVALTALAKPQITRVDPDAPVVADGKSAIELELRDVPDGEWSVEASAGTLQPPQEKRDGSWRVRFVPPRLVERSEVNVRVVNAAGGQVASVTLVAFPSGRDTAQGQQASDGAFGLRGPARMILGLHESAKITLTAPEGAEPALLASVGTLSEPVRTPSGEIEVELTPPADKSPRVVLIVAVSADGTLFDWLRIPLWARPRVDTTSEPGARVRVELGNETYGPVTIPARGRVTMRVLAPPGRSLGHTRVEDALGNTHTDDLKLTAPPFPRVVAFCPSVGDVRVVAFATTRTGLPVEQGLDAHVDKGALGEPKRLAPGVFESRWEGGVGIQSSMAHVSVGEAETDRASCTLHPGSLPARLDLTVARTWEAGTGPLPVEVELRYPTGERRREVEVDFVTDAGSIEGANRISPESYRAMLQLSDVLRDKTQAQVEVFTRTDPPVRGVATIVLEPGPPARLDASAADSTLAPQEKTVIRVRARDRFGNPVKVNLAGESVGSLGAFREAEPGQYVAEYVAPKPWSQDSDDVTIEHADSDASVRASVAIMLRRRTQATSAALAAGYLTNFGKVSGPQLSARVELSWSPIRLGLESGFYVSNQVEKVDGSGVRLLTRAVPTMLRATYQVPGRIRPYGGIGVGAIFHSTEVTASAGVRAQTLTEPLACIAPILGAEYPIGKGRVLVEAQYIYAPLDDDAVRGNLGGLRAGAGYRYDF